MPSITAPLHLVDRAAGVDDRGGRRRRPTHTFSTFTLAAAGHAHARHLGEVAAVAELERDSHADAFALRLAAPARLLGTRASTPRMRPGSNWSFGGFGPLWPAMAASSRSSRNCSGSLPAACASSSRNDWNAAAERVAARRAQRVDRDAHRHERRVEAEVGHEAGRELLGRDVGGRHELLALAERHEVVRARRRGGPTASTPRLEGVEPARAVEVVLHVVLARPQQLDRRAAHLARDPRGLDHEVVGQAPAEAAADARHVDVMSLERDAEESPRPARARSRASGSAPRSRACRP